MNRRKAIQQLAIFSAGVAFLPACQVEPIPLYTNLSIGADQWQLMTWLTEAILPKKGEPIIVTPESAAHFVFTMVNDCYAPDEIVEYESGMRLFTQFVSDKYRADYQVLNEEQHVLMLTEIYKSDLLPDSLKFFMDVTKQLTVRHFTTSEYFLKTHLDFEFIPSRFNGCILLEV